jgi:hypothetical protein
MLPTLRTEEEMRQVWCPKAIAKTYSEAPTGANRDSQGGAAEECNCLATGCACFVFCTDLRRRIVGYCGLIGGTETIVVPGPANAGV